MSIINVQRVSIGQVGVSPGKVLLMSTDDLATITEPGYLSNNTAAGQLSPYDVVEAFYSVINGNGTFGTFTISVSDHVNTLVSWPVISPSVSIRSVYCSTDGSDEKGNGTIDSPFATVQVATAHAVTLAPTLFFPVNVIMDPGQYTVTGLTLSPNINYYANGGSGVFWIGTGKITFNASTFTDAAASISFGGMQIGGMNQSSSFGFNLDSSALENFSCTINLNDGFVHETASPIFKAGAGHTYNLNLNGYVELDLTGDSTMGAGTKFDGISLTGNGPHSISATGNVFILSTNNGCFIQSVGNTGIGTIQGTASAGNNIQAGIFAGYRVNIQSLTDNFGNLISFQRDETTYLPGTTYEGTFGDTIVDNNISPGFNQNTTVSDFYADTIDFANGFGFIKKQIAYLSLPASQLQAMYAAPQELISAIPGCAIVINQLTLNFVYGGTNQFAGGGVIIIQYGTAVHGAGPSAIASANIGAAGLLTGTTNLYNIQQGVSGAGINSSSDIINTGIYISNQTAAFTAGDNNTVMIAIEYNVVPLT